MRALTRSDGRVHRVLSVLAQPNGFAQLGGRRAGCCAGAHAKQGLVPQRGCAQLRPGVAICRAIRVSALCSAEPEAQPRPSTFKM